MIGSLNKVILVGEVDGNVEVKVSSPSGRRMAKFSLKTTSSWVDRDGTHKDSIEKHMVVVFNEKLVNVVESLRSGAKCYVEGSLQYSKWQDNNTGNYRFSVEVVLPQYRGTLEVLAQDNFSSMGCVNKVMLIGNLGKDPVVRVSSTNGKKIASMVVATSESYKNSEGNKMQKVEWHDVVVFNNHLSQVIEQYVRKGTKLYLEGNIRSRIRQDEDGERQSTEIIIPMINGDMTILSPSSKSQTNDSHSGSDDDNDYDDDMPF
ncbi:single-stranded DNA-binding protein [Candidatus Gromoviella agglomerans]|uniref:single-stranded DNA-binding protein n=1 Tax=Candidatus Gromoviella agglomerans TaxID=2806609 RepID=UPI001E4B8C34|nr:single-stranded DNA-binding protein [Candidatus Gromoviella agglomerans]UFX98170.1 Single-stranded DNA-binding protein [Candidatus Gromoviella agglomerans]